MKNSLKCLLVVTGMTVFVALPAYAGSGRNGQIVCADFDTQAEAQAYFDAKKAGYRRLDRNHDGVACESLP